MQKGAELLLMLLLCQGDSSQLRAGALTGAFLH